MNGRFQMQGGKNGILPKYINANRFFWDCHWLEIWSNHFCPSMGLNEGSVATDSGNSVDTEFRMVFVLSSLPYSVRNCLKSRGISYCIIRQNFAEFRDFSCTKFCISNKGSYSPHMSRWSLAPV